MTIKNDGNNITMVKIKGGGVGLGVLRPPWLGTVNLITMKLVLKQQNFNFRAQCYKTFYSRNLQILVISWSVCPWQKFTA
jgi:hypothetical protein